MCDVINGQPLTISSHMFENSNKTLGYFPDEFNNQLEHDQWINMRHKKMQKKKKDNCTDAIVYQNNIKFFKAII